LLSNRVIDFPIATEGETFAGVFVAGSRGGEFRFAFLANVAFESLVPAFYVAGSATVAAVRIAVVAGFPFILLHVAIAAIWKDGTTGRIAGACCWWVAIFPCIAATIATSLIAALLVATVARFQIAIVALFVHLLRAITARWFNDNRVFDIAMVVAAVV
jgi:hypothetical protein